MFCGSQHINLGHLLSDLSLSMLWLRYSGKCDYFENFYFLLLFDRLYKYHWSCVLSLNPTTLSKSLTILSSFFLGGGAFHVGDHTVYKKDSLHLPFQSACLFNFCFLPCCTR